ncbi:MAG: hypothetical protein Q9M91_05755 [Candidatus Dojkabacteria bacterium]|nr:hypothetical protein [Candidatus Dojkabacteria bacterium]MDQ7021304.1 hypothetical protein [Candidatus Dojkabacteria bacterium]
MADTPYSNNNNSNANPNNPYMLVPNPNYVGNPTTNPTPRPPAPNINNNMTYATNAAARAHLTRRQIELMKLKEIDEMIPKRRGNSWSGLLFRPKSIRFENQNDYEYVFVVVRSHWSSNIAWIVRNVLYSFIPILLLVLYSYFNISLSFVSAINVSIFFLAFYSVIMTNVIRDFFDWYFDPYIVTNQRIVHYEFKPFSSYTIKETNLENIEFVREKSAGVLAGIFDYGTIIVATASEQSLFEFKKIPEATLVRDIITDLRTIHAKYN